MHWFVPLLATSMLAGCAGNTPDVPLTPTTLVDAAPFVLSDPVWPAPDSVGWLHWTAQTRRGPVVRDSVAVDWYRVQAGGGMAWLGRFEHGVQSFRLEFPGRTLAEVAAHYRNLLGKPMRTTGTNGGSVEWLVGSKLFTLTADVTTGSTSGTLQWVLVEGGEVAPVTDWDACQRGIIQLCPRSGLP